MTYDVQTHSAALRELHKLPRPALGDAIKAMIGLVSDPRPHGARALVGEPTGTMRVRLGDYRIVYVVNDAARAIVVYRVAHRREAYDG